MPKVLIADKMDKCAEEIFARNHIPYDIKTGLSPEDIAAIIGDYDAVACRSSAKITKDVLKNAGAVLPTRDTLDERIINDVKNGTGNFIKQAIA